MQTATFRMKYEELMYNELRNHTVNARKDEDIFQYLNRHMHRDNVQVKEWKNSTRIQENSETSGMSNSRIVKSISKKLHSLKYGEYLNIDSEVDALYKDEDSDKKRTNGKAKNSKAKNDLTQFSERCSKFVKKEKMGNFIKVEIEHGKIRCNCESFMRYGFCPEKALFSLLCNNEAPPTDCVSGRGIQ